jgi:hypothetical protein
MVQMNLNDGATLLAVSIGKEICKAREKTLGQKGRAEMHSHHLYER